MDTMQWLSSLRPLPTETPTTIIYLKMDSSYTTVTNTFYPVAATRLNAYIGKSGWSDPYFNGAVDFFNVYNQALSDVQVANLYTSRQHAASPPGTPTTCTVRSQLSRYPCVRPSRLVWTDLPRQPHLCDGCIHHYLHVGGV